MRYTKKMIKRILVIQEFVETSNTLSKVYSDFDNKEFTKETITDKQRIYKVFCSSMYNLIIAIKYSKDIFGKAIKYNEFEEMINQKYVANDNKYYSKENYESNLFKIIETIRHQNNHYQRDDEDDTVLFEVYIDFNIVDNLRKIIKNIFYEIYNKIDKEKMKQIILSKPKIQYSFDKITNKMDELKLKMSESENRLNKIFKEDNERSMQLFEELFNADNMYDLLAGNKKAIEKFDLVDIEIQYFFDKVDKYIIEHGTNLEKEAMELLKDFIKEKEDSSINDINKNLLDLQERAKSLNEKYGNNE